MLLSLLIFCVAHLYFAVGTLYDSMLAVFSILYGDHWIATADDAMKATQEFHFFYFLALYALGNLILLRLFIPVQIYALKRERLLDFKKDVCLYLYLYTYLKNLSVKHYSAYWQPTSIYTVE